MTGIEERNARINRMSEAFDRLSRVSAILGEKAEELESMASDVDCLKEYMASGQWIRDFEADEKGQLPAALKRGVLSEDGVFNLMEEHREDRKSVV